MAMDAYVQLALIEKTKRVFAADAGIFLSFPLLSPLSFKPEALAVLSSPASPAGYATAADFARIVNFLPRDIVASAYDDRYLWDVYADVLERADVADGRAVEPGEAQNRDTALLYDLNPDGTRTETAAYRAYRQYRDAWIVACEDYGERQVTGEFTDNPDAARHWVEVDEPVLRAAREKAESDWKTLGLRDEIEAALQAEREEAERDPRARWRQWNNGFNPDIDLLTEPSGSRFGPTGLSPKDFATNTNWLHFDLSAGEMAKLVSEAPAALKVVLDDAAGRTIDSVSFDYRSVAVVRSWFQSAVLTSRVWRSSDPDLALSDGGNPASGVCPGYVAAIVFMRNLQVRSRSAPTAPSGVKIVDQLRFTLPVDLLVQRKLQVRTPLPAVATPAPTPPSAAALRAFAQLERQTLTSAPTLATKLSVKGVASGPTAAAAAPATPTLRMAETVRPFRAVIVDATPVPGRVKPITPPAPPVSPPQPTPSPVVAAPTSPTPPGRDEVAILAFICKRLPKTPDPLPDLRWG